MEDKEILEMDLNVDSQDAEKAMENALEALEAIRTTAENIGAILKTAFAPMKTGLQDVTIGAKGAAAAIEKMNVTIQKLMEQMANEQVADQWLGGISTTIDAVSLGIDISKLAEKMKPGLDDVTKVIRRCGDESSSVIKGLFSADTFNSLVGAASGAVGSVVSGLSNLKGKLGECTSAWISNTTAKITSKAEDIAIIGLYVGDFMKAMVAGVAQLAKNTAAWVANTAAKVASKAEDIAIIGLYVGDFVKAMAIGIAELAKNTAGWIANAAAKAGSTAAEWAQIAATTAWTAICTAATAVTSAFGVAMSVLTSPITLVIAGIAALVAGIVLLIKNWDTVKEVAIRAWEGIKAAFSTAWSWFESKVLNPLVDGVKGGVNGVIGFINGLIAAAVKGINSLIGMLNKLRFTVPDWVPGLGGETIGFSLSTIKAPQIPYLAKGAVLPANKPFLAMVGDQKHGTNVEAPLSTIQEAVAVVLDEQLNALMAGFNATVQEIRNLREDVGNIRVGDEVIWRAAERYRDKRAVMQGAGW